MADYAPLIRPTLVIIGRVGKAGISMSPVIRRADESHAQTVHHIMSAIPWISEAVKSRDGFIKLKELCVHGEVFVITVNFIISSIMILKKDNWTESDGHNIWTIPLIATIEAERRKGHARKLVRKAKQIVGNGVIQAYVENDKSLSLLVSEGFVPVEGRTDLSGHPLYEWTANSASESGGT
ncbi:MAG: hypothetical protein ACREFQ_16785 [Stellaceae bacterium]